MGNTRTHPPTHPHTHTRVEPISLNDTFSVSLYPYIVGLFELCCCFAAADITFSLFTFFVSWPWSPSELYVSLMPFVFTLHCKWWLAIHLHTSSYDNMYISVKVFYNVRGSDFIVIELSSWRRVQRFFSTRYFAEILLCHCIVFQVHNNCKRWPTRRM